MGEIFLPTSPLHLLYNVQTLFFFLPTLLPAERTGYGHIFAQQVGKWLQVPGPRVSQTQVGLLQELRPGLSYVCTEAFIYPHCSSHVKRNCPIGHPQGANLSTVHSPGPHGDLAWPSYRLALAARCLLSKTHSFSSTDSLRPAPASRVLSLQAEIKFLSYVEKNSCKSLALLQLKAELIPHSSKNQNNKFHMSLQLL